MMPGSSANDKKSRPKTKSAPSKSAVDKDVPESQSTEVDIPMSDATNLVESQEDSQVSEYGTEGDTQVVDQETQEVCLCSLSQDNILKTVFHRNRRHSWSSEYP